MISRSDWEPLPTPTLSPFARGYLSLCRFFTAAVWCVPALRVPLVHSLINHFRQKRSIQTNKLQTSENREQKWGGAMNVCHERHHRLHHEQSDQEKI